MEPQTYTYSQLSAQAVAKLLARFYALPQAMQCRFYVLGLHDNYLIECGNRRFGQLILALPYSGTSMIRNWLSVIARILSVFIPLIPIPSRSDNISPPAMSRPLMTNR
jgi:hypothetical protein